MIYKNIMDLTTTILAGVIVAAIATFYLIALSIDCITNNLTEGRKLLR